MMKINVLSVMLCMVLSFSGLATHAQNTVVSGQLKGMAGGKVKIFYNKEGMSKTDTVTAVGDSFTWTADLNEPVRIALTAGRNNYYFFAAPGQIRLTGIKDSIRTYTLSGSPMQLDAETFRAFTKDLTDQWHLLDSTIRTASEEEKAAIKKKQDDLRKSLYEREKQFIGDHPGSLYSVYRVSLYRDYDVIKTLYNELDESARQTTGGKRIAQRLEALANSQIGTQMVNFTQADTSRHPVSFSSFKGKYVLVDFWASWCMPCRAENPNVLKAYNRFKNSGFSVIGISLDDNPANWKKAIRDDKMPWTQLSDLKGWGNELAVFFGIQAIPANLLVDPSGKIIARNLRGERLHKKLGELLN